MSAITSTADYKKERVLGPFSAGVLWLIRRRSDKKLFTAKYLTSALYVTNESVRREIKEEVEASLHLNHPNIVRNCYAFEEDNQLILITEQCGITDEQVTLDNLIHKGKSFSQSQIQTWLTNLVDAVKYLHDNNVIHYDIRTKNIYFDPPIVKLGGFGLAKLLKYSPRRSSASGRLRHMAPEAFKGPAAFKSDVWSLGIVLYEMVALKEPFSPEGAVNKLIQKIADDPYTPIDRARHPYDDSLYELIDQMLPKNPKDRLSISEVQRHPFLKPPSPPPPPPLPALAPPPLLPSPPFPSKPTTPPIPKEKMSADGEDTVKKTIATENAETKTAAKQEEGTEVLVKHNRILKILLSIFAVALGLLGAALGVYYGVFASAIPERNVTSIMPNVGSQWSFWNGAPPSAFPMRSPQAWNDSSRLSYLTLPPIWSLHWASTLMPSTVRNVPSIFAASPLPSITTVDTSAPPSPFFIVSNGVASSTSPLPSPTAVDTSAPPSPFFIVSNGVASSTSILPSSTAVDTTEQPTSIFLISNYSRSSDEDKNDFAISIATDAAKKWSDYFSQCRYIAETLQNRYSDSNVYGSYWLCAVATKWRYTMVRRQNNSIILETTNYNQTIYYLLIEEECTPSSTLKTVTRNNGTLIYGPYRRYQNDTNFFYDHMQTVINTTKSDQEKDPGVISQDLNANLQKKFGGFWSVTVGEILAAYVPYRSPYYIWVKSPAPQDIVTFMNVECIIDVGTTKTTPNPRSGQFLVTNYTRSSDVDMKGFAASVAADAVNKSADFYSQCKYIVESFQQRYNDGSYWSCVIATKWRYAIPRPQNNTIILETTNNNGSALYYLLIQEECTPSSTLKTVTRSNGTLNYGSYRSYRNDTNFYYDHMQMVINIATADAEKDPGQIAQDLNTNLQAKFGGYWTVLFGDILEAHFYYRPPFYVWLKGEHDVITFMTTECIVITTTPPPIPKFNISSSTTNKDDDMKIFAVLTATDAAIKWPGDYFLHCQFIVEQFLKRYEDADKNAWLCAIAKASSWSFSIHLKGNNSIITRTTDNNGTNLDYLLIQQDCTSPGIDGVKEASNTASTVSYGLYRRYRSDPLFYNDHMQTLINTATADADKELSNSSMDINNNLRTKFGGRWSILIGDFLAAYSYYRSPYYIWVKGPHDVISLMNALCYPAQSLLYYNNLLKSYEKYNKVTPLTS